MVFLQGKDASAIDFQRTRLDLETAQATDRMQSNSHRQRTNKERQKRWIQMRVRLRVQTKTVGHPKNPQTTRFSIRTTLFGAHKQFIVTER